MVINPTDRLDPKKFDEDVRFTSWIDRGEKRQVIYHDGSKTEPLGLFIQYFLFFFPTASYYHVAFCPS